MSSFYRQQLETYLSCLDIDAESVLDIGGAANPVKGRVRKWNVKRYDIADNEQEEKAKGVGDIFVMDLNYPTIIGKKYDIVFCLETMEYVFDPVQATQNIATLTRDGGVAYITFPFLYPHHNPVDTDYLRYTRVGVEKLLDVAGFSKSEIEPRTQMGEKRIQEWYTSEKMHAAKGWPGHDWIGFVVKAVK